VRVPESTVRLLSNGDTALAVEFGERIGLATSGLVLALYDRLARAALPGVVELLPTFRSLMIHYDPARTSHGAIARQIEPMLGGLESVRPATRRWIRSPGIRISPIPSCRPDGSVVPGVNIIHVEEQHHRHRLERPVGLADADGAAPLRG